MTMTKRSHKNNACFLLFYMKGYLLGILLLCSGHVLNAKSVSHSDIFTVANNFLLVQTQTGFAANTTISDLDTLSDDDTGR